MTQKYAVVQNQVAVRTIVTDSLELAQRNTPAGATCVPCADNIEAGWTYKQPPNAAAGASPVWAPVAPVALSAADLLDDMLDTIDAEREQLMMTQLTGGGAKKYEYAEKAREVNDYRSLTGTVLAGLLLPVNLAATRSKFRWSMAEADDTGDTLAVVIQRYETAMAATGSCYKVAARAQKLKRALRAAAPAARAAIFAARSWPA